MQTLTYFAVLNFLDIFIICMYFATGGDRRICCNITEAKIDQSILMAIHAISQWNCSHFKLKPS